MHFILNNVIFARAFLQTVNLTIQKTYIPVAQIKLHCLSSQLSQFLTERDQTLSTAVTVHEHDWTEDADCY